MKTLVEVAKEYHIEYSPLCRKFKRSIEQLEGHYEIINGTRYVDEYAEKILRPKNGRLLLDMQREKYEDDISDLTESYETKIQQLEEEKEAEIESFKRKMDEKIQKVRAEFEEKLEKISGDLYWAEQKIKEQNQMINDYEVIVRDKTDEMKKLKKQIGEMQERIEEYEKMEQELEKTKAKKGLFR